MNILQKSKRNVFGFFNSIKRALMEKNIIDNDKSFNEKGLKYFKVKKYEKALKNFNKAISLKNDVADYYRNRAYCYYELKLFEAGDIDFNEASKIDEIIYALGALGDRFTPTQDFGRHVETLLKYKDDERFSKEIQKAIAFFIK